MRPNINFAECLKDSPRFRNSLESAETDLDQLEVKLEKVVKLCNGMIETGKVYNSANSAFVSGVWDVASHFREDELVSDDNIVAEALEKMTRQMNEILKYHNILLDQAHRSICKNLNNFIRNDIRKVKETRRHFEKISDDMDNALVKNSQCQRARPAECEDANNVLTATRACFGHVSLDYVFQLNILHSKKRFDILDTMLAYMHAQNAFFHQGHDLFDDLDPYLKSIATQLEELSRKAASERKEMEERHTLVQKRELSLTTTQPPASPNHADVRMEGYLFKRTSNAFKSWVRRWFMIRDNQLVYCKRSSESGVTVMEEDLRLVSVKPVPDQESGSKRFCFEVLSPGRSHMLQADSDAEVQSWMNAFQAGISKAYRDNSCNEGGDINDNSRLHDKSNSIQKSTSGSNVSSRMEQLLAIPGNNMCCDCGSPEPRWSSINLGITLCIECSGIHRSFGVHMSKVRSVTLDAWEPELVKVMVELGNQTINSIYEANVDENVAKRATPQCHRSERESWIRAKYVDRAFVKTLPIETTSEHKGKRWSVCKRKRRSPSKSSAEQEETSSSEGQKLIQGSSQDSGLGGSTPDVIVFGAAVNQEELDKTRRHVYKDVTGLVLEDSEESVSDIEADTRSTTSMEDVSRLCPDLLLYRAAQARNLSVVMEALSLGADPNWLHPDEDGRTPLIQAVESGSLASSELLLLNGAKVDKKDNLGQTPLHHATMLGHTGQVCQFLKRNANQHAVDINGMDPLKIAIKAANADIVTLLRLAKLNEEMKEIEGVYGGPDETFSDVFRDFTHMASNNPEKLNRRSSQGKSSSDTAITRSEPTDTCPDTCHSNTDTSSEHTTIPDIIPVHEASTDSSTTDTSTTDTPTQDA